MKLINILLLVLVIGQALAFLRRGARCDYDPDWCARGLTCVGNPGNMRCYRLRSLGQKCGLNPFQVCKDGLVCEDNVCTKPKIGRGRSCNDPEDVCEDGLSCVGPKGNLKCFPLRKLGQKCGGSFRICEEGLLCENNVCAKPKIGKKGSCNNPDDVCEDGLTCLGKEGNKKCFALRKLGMKCGRDPFWVCEDGLVCEDNICTKPKIGRGGSCNDPDDVCEDGLSCLGNTGNKKCFAKRMLGEQCKRDPFWVCEDGLECEDNVCVKPKIGRRGSCNEPDDVCEDGLNCVGPDGNKKCFPPKKLGQPCRDPFWVCEEGLLCEDKVCVKPKIGRGESCNDPDDVCEDGLSCVGREGNKKCFALRKLGMKCGRDPFWVCEDGLICEDNICSKPKIGKGGSCNDPSDVCEDGLSCVGNQGNKKCFALRKLGMKCGLNPFGVCEDGLICEDNVCAKPKIGKRGSCNEPDDVCEDGLACVGNEGNKKCFALKKLGMVCGRDPFWVCEDGLVCEDNICAKPKIGRGGSCNEDDDVCEDGLSCLGREGNKKCFAKRKLGEKCGGDPFWVCEDGLACKHKICVKH